MVISDGGENNSRYTPTEIKNVVKESDVLIYSIGVFADPNYTDAGGVLNTISEQTGGRMFKTEGMRLSDIAQKISIDLRNRYLLGYVPSNARAQWALSPGGGEDRASQGSASGEGALADGILRADGVDLAD